MNDTREIVLFFDKNTSYDALDVAKEIVERYPELGNPMILPELENQNNPVITFKLNPEFQIQSNYHTFNFLVKRSYFDKLVPIIFDMVDTFEGFNCKFVRLGYISSSFLSPKYVDKARKRFLKLEYIDDPQDINLGFYKRLVFKYGKINCWEKVITNSLEFNDLLMQYDFNSPIDDIVEFDIKYIKEFINVANEYIEDRLDF